MEKAYRTAVTREYRKERPRWQTNASDQRLRDREHEQPYNCHPANQPERMIEHDS
jgi:hypothetical protein